MKRAVKVAFKVCYFFYVWLEGIVLCLTPSRFLYKDLKGVALITGGGSGIGRLLALRFSLLGCRVVVWDVNVEGNRETVRLVNNQGGECYSYLCDVTRREEVYQLAERVKKEVGPVSILVNNAGIVNGKSLLDLPDHLIEKVFQVNAISHFWTCKAFLADMMSVDQGHIVTISSVVGFFGINNLSDYCASKAAASAAHEAISLELRHSNHTGIKMTLVAPSFASTGLFEGFDAGYFSVLTPEYVADSIISAVRSNREVVIIPSYFVPLIMLKALIPQSAFYALYELLKGYDTMKNFVGRSGNKVK